MLCVGFVDKPPLVVLGKCDEIRFKYLEIIMADILQSVD